MGVLASFLESSWQPGSGDPRSLVNPATEAEVAQVAAAGSLEKAVAFARDVGGPALRKMSFVERGQMLKAMSKAIHEAREELIEIAIANGGNTRGDAKFDIDGATAVLSTYAFLSKDFGEAPWLLLDAEATPIFRNSKIRGQHVLLPRRGVAVHINAFNFPAWGMMGKAAVALLAGMPVISKPATSSSHLAHRIFEILAEQNLFPEGAFSLLMGPAGDLLDHLGPQDVVAFTGSADTGAIIRSHPRVVAKSVRVNIEADSLNAAVLGPDMESGTELFDLVLRDIGTEMTQKAGQKCTATRRILVPENVLDTVQEALVERLGDLAAQVGNPADKSVRMGPLSTAGQLRDGRAGLAKLAEAAEIVRGNPERSEFIGVDPGKGYFLEPILLRAAADKVDDPNAAFHQVEVFGPVATLLPYEGSVEAAARIIGHGEGSLVSTVYSDDRKFTAGAVAEFGAWLGRVVLADEKHAGASMAPGGVFATNNHGGPGRAGCGEELGGKHGMALYMQRTAIQAGAGSLARLVGR